MNWNLRLRILVLGLKQQYLFFSLRVLGTIGSIPYFALPVICIWLCSVFCLLSNVCICRRKCELGGRVTNDEATSPCSAADSRRRNAAPHKHALLTLDRREGVGQTTGVYTRLLQHAKNPTVSY